MSDSFFDKFTELPRNVQQNVRDFQKKFRQNSQSSAIHLESITQFKDSSLKTARVNQEYRAVVGALGQDNYMLLRKVLIPPLLLMERVSIKELVFFPTCTTFAPVSRF